MIHRLAAAVLALAVLYSAPASAQNLVTAAAAAVAQEQQQPHVRWQQEYDLAKRRQKVSKIKMYAGLGAVGVGFLIAAQASGESRPDEGRIMTGVLIDAGGGIVFIWGLMQYLDAKGDVALLESNRPRGSASLRLSDHQALVVGGRTLSYAVSW